MRLASYEAAKYIPRPPLLTIAVCAPFYLDPVNALAPEVQADANVYHLLPALDSLRYGGFSKAIDFYNSLPHAFELLYVPAWRIGGSSAAKLVHFAFLLASTALIVRLAARFELPRMSGPIAAAAVYSAHRWSRWQERPPSTTRPWYISPLPQCYWR